MKINNKQELEARIIEFEKKKVIQESLLVSQFHTTKESLRPKNLIKKAFSNLGTPGTAAHTVLKAASGLGIGILTKQVLGKSNSLTGKLLNTAVELTAGTGMYKNTDKLKAYGIAIYHNLFKNKKPIPDFKP
jgi:hypothetical protein